MRAAVLYGIDQLIKIEDFELESSVPGKSLIQVQYCALNHRDFWITKGQYSGLKFPIILGSDICGYYKGKEVIANPSMSWGGNEKVQSKSYSILGLPEHGGLAEFVYSNPEYIYNKPAHLSAAQAASLPLAGLTAYRSLITRAKVNAEDKVFISGIGGGVALFALQFAVQSGAEVYVSSSDDRKIEKAITLGAKDGFNYKQEDWPKSFLQKYDGASVIVDGAGGPDFAKLVKIAYPAARIVVYGATNGAWSNVVIQQVFWKQLNILGSTMGSDLDFSNMLQFVEEKKIIPVVDQIFNLSQINQAFEYMSSGKQFGKIVIAVSN
ncbi:MAG: zinc-binding dehydrogenase [Saprospiraceae bacterium]|nr:zinc-binding dehydrogenase [Saprospiraceae bacterium]